MSASIIVFIGLDQIPEEDFSASVVEVVRALKGFGTTPIRFVLMRMDRHNSRLRSSLINAIALHTSATAITDCTAPSSIEVLVIDEADELLPCEKRPEAVTNWLAARVAELAEGMGREKSSVESCGSGHSVEVNHGSDTDVAAGAVRDALATKPSPFASSLGCVLVVDSVLHDIALVGEGHCVSIISSRISPKEAFTIAQIVRRTPTATRRALLPSGARLTGIVKRYNPTKGYGFVTVNGQDVFVHQSHIVAEGFRGLNIGANVGLFVEILNGKPEAREVRQGTPYIPTFESEAIVEGTHRNAGAPPEVRKERRQRRAKEAPVTSNSNLLEASPESQETQSRAKPQEINAKTDLRIASVPHPKGQLVFTNESIPYTFRAHDGTMYCFPMPILVQEGEAPTISASGHERRKPIAARIVTGGFPPRSTSSSHSFFTRSPIRPPRHQREARTYLNPSSPPYVPGRVQPPLPPPQNDAPLTSKRTTGALRQHSPYESPVSPLNPHNKMPFLIDPHTPNSLDRPEHVRNVNSYMSTLIKSHGTSQKQNPITETTDLAAAVTDSPRRRR